MCSSQPSGYNGKNAATISLADYARIAERIGLLYDFVCFYALVPLCLFNQEKLERLLELGRLKVSCSLFGNVVAVDPRGFLLPCTHMAGLHYGNLNDPSVVESFLEQKEEEIRVLSSHAPSQKCVDCKLWNTCHGGCNLIWFSRNAADCIPGITSNQRKEEVAQ
ncbi:MAG: SPASM domain-containing protein [Candidatus Staskawiczbacteria bacterium]|nr:SPASM domain-containing protein [Candidatus Staskawiczbacteria bacterium]